MSPKSKSLLSRIFVAFLAAFFFASNVLLAHAMETNIWAERKKSLQLASLPSPSLLSPINDPMRSSEFGVRKKELLINNLTPSSTLRIPHPALIPIVRALPSHYGTLRSISRPAGQPSKGTIIHIQDVHMNQDAQANIGKAVQALIDRKQIGLVGLEGAFDEILLKPFRDFPRQDLVTTVADYLLKEFKISGPVHTAYTSPTDIPPFIGVDHKGHYQANVEAYRQSSKIQEPRSKEIQKFKVEVQKEKEWVFNKDLLEFDQMVEAYRNGNIGLGEYLGFLTGVGAGPPKDGSDEVDFHARPMLRASWKLGGRGSPPLQIYIEVFLEAFALESSLDFGQVEVQRGFLIKKLLDTLTETEVKDLLRHSVAFRTGSVTHVEFYSFLKNLCDSNGISLRQYPAMRDYLQYVLLSDSIKAEELFREMADLEKDGYAQLTRTEEEQDLIQEGNYLYLVGKLVNFELTPEEWGEYKDIKKTVVPAEAGIQAVNMIFDNRFKTWIPAFAGTTNSFEDFYLQAELRNTAITSNLLKTMEKLNTKTAVLVSGGFHSKGINTQLTEAGFTTITFVPRISEVKDQRTANGEQRTSYLSIFSQQKTPLDKLLQGERLFVTPEVAISPMAYAGLMKLVKFQRAIRFFGWMIHGVFNKENGALLRAWAVPVLVVTGMAAYISYLTYESGAWQTPVFFILSVVSLLLLQRRFNHFKWVRNTIPASSAVWLGIVMGYILNIHLGFMEVDPVRDLAMMSLGGLPSGSPRLSQLRDNLIRFQSAGPRAKKSYLELLRQNLESLSKQSGILDESEMVFFANLTGEVESHEVIGQTWINILLAGWERVKSPASREKIRSAIFSALKRNVLASTWAQELVPILRDPAPPEDAPQPIVRAPHAFSHEALEPIKFDGEKFPDLIRDLSKRKMNFTSVEGVRLFVEDEKSHKLIEEEAPKISYLEDETIGPVIKAPWLSLLIVDVEKTKGASIIAGGHEERTSVDIAAKKGEREFRIHGHFGPDHAADQFSQTLEILLNEGFTDLRVIISPRGRNQDFGVSRLEERIAAAVPEKDSPSGHYVNFVWVLNRVKEQEISSFVTKHWMGWFIEQHSPNSFPIWTYELKDELNKGKTHFSENAAMTIPTKLLFRFIRFLMPNIIPNPPPWVKAPLVALLEFGFYFALPLILYQTYAASFFGPGIHWIEYAGLALVLFTVFLLAHGKNIDKGVVTVAAINSVAYTLAASFLTQYPTWAWIPVLAALVLHAWHDWRVIRARGRPAIRILVADMGLEKPVFGQIKDLIKDMGLEGPVELIDTGIDFAKGELDTEKLLEKLIPIYKPTIIVFFRGKKAFKKRSLVQLAVNNGVRVVVRAGAGYENISTDNTLDKGVPFLRTPFNRSVAHMTMRFLFGSLRLEGPGPSSPDTADVSSIEEYQSIFDFPLEEFDEALRESHEELDRGEMTPDQKELVFGALSKTEFLALAKRLEGKIIGLQGFGKIAEDVAFRLSELKRITGINFKIWAHAPSLMDPNSDRAKRARELGVTYVPEVRLFQEADVISVHIPSSDANQNYIDRDLFKGRPKDKKLVLINSARRDIVDESLFKDSPFEIVYLSDLDFEAESDRLRAENPKNMIFTPHIGGLTKTAVHDRDKKFLSTLKSLFLILRGKSTAGKESLKILNGVPIEPLPSVQPKKERGDPKEAHKDFWLTGKMMTRITSEFRDQIQNSIAGEDSSLALLKTFAREISGNETGKFISADWGGTNGTLRMVELLGNGQFNVGEPLRFRIDGFKEDPRLAFALFAAKIEELIGGDREGRYKIGLSFAFPLDQHAINSATSLKLTKGWKDGPSGAVIGEDVAALFNRALEDRGLENVRIGAIANDTFNPKAVFNYEKKYEGPERVDLSDRYFVLEKGRVYRNVYVGAGNGDRKKGEIHLHEVPDAEFGGIAGTGTNFVGDVGALEGDRNLESGNFDLGEFHLQLITDEDRTIVSYDPPGQQLSEKMISGGYLGEIVRLRMNTLFNWDSISAFKEKNGFDSRYLSRIAGDDSSDLKDIGRILLELRGRSTWLGRRLDNSPRSRKQARWLGRLALFWSTYEQRAVLKRVSGSVVRRSARLLAAEIAALVTNIDEDVSKLHTIAIEGALFEYYPNYPVEVWNGIGEILGWEKANRIYLVGVRNADGIGVPILAAQGEAKTVLHDAPLVKKSNGGPPGESSVLKGFGELKIKSQGGNIRVSHGFRNITNDEFDQYGAEGLQGLYEDDEKRVVQRNFDEVIIPALESFWYDHPEELGEDFTAETPLSIQTEFISDPDSLIYMSNPGDSRMVIDDEAVKLPPVLQALLINHEVHADEFSAVMGDLRFYRWIKEKRDLWNVYLNNAIGDNPELFDDPYLQFLENNFGETDEDKRRRAVANFVLSQNLRKISAGFGNQDPSSLEELIDHTERALRLSFKKSGARANALDELTRISRLLTIDPAGLKDIHKELIDALDMLRKSSETEDWGTFFNRYKTIHWYIVNLAV